VEKLLGGLAAPMVMELMRTYLDCLYRLAEELPRARWAPELVTALGRVYTCWRRHWATELDHLRPEDETRQELLRYYILGNECLLVLFLQRAEELWVAMARDCLELATILPDLPAAQAVRVRGLRFHLACLKGDEEEAYWESQLLLCLYTEDGAEAPELPLASYPAVTPAFLQQHAAALARARQLEQLNTLFQDNKHAEIVALLSATLDCTDSTYLHLV
jgi:hypothetical protein